ncbi:macrolide family glycosyltransferase [Streptomyces sp. NPDC048442]|uniref:macrolide family glycosyltransferase n=1 Tax=Streptomyces sp. NPDC048442 TaxID=3154823 RepID=UPI003412AEC1
MSKHIAFFNFPAFGHINPNLGVVQELVGRGHRVTCTATDHFAPAIEACGAEPVRYTSVFGDYYTSPFTAETVKGEGMRSFREATTLAEAVEDFYAKDLPDVVVYDFMAWGARFFAAKHDLPAVRLFPSYGANEAFAIHEKFPMAEMSDPQVRDMLTELEAHLPSTGLPGTTAMEFLTKIEDLGIVFLPREFHYDGDSFDERFVFAGPCLGDRSAFQGSWQPSGDGDRPVLLISLGTAATGRPEFFPMAVEAFKDSEWEVVMAVGDHVDPAELGELPSHFHVSRRVPQLDVLGHASLFITHGGMNSTMESLHNGVPMVVVPQMNEQRANGLRVEELGLGRLLPAADTTVESLRKYAAEVHADQSVKDRVTALQSRMHEVEGPAVAADAIEGFLASGR